jgi:hypothetical protein
MNTASKNNWDNVIGASSSLARRRTAELNVQMVKQEAVALKHSILSKHIHLLHFRNTCVLTARHKDNSHNACTLFEEISFSYYRKTNRTRGKSMPSTWLT